MDEGVLPADDVAVRPPPLPERMVGLGDEDVRKPFVPSRVTWSSFRRSRSNASEPFEPLISQLKRVLAAGGEARRLDRPDRAVLELDDRLERVVDLAARHGTCAVEAETAGDLADEVAREVDHVRAEVAERAGAGRVLVEPPRLRRRRRPTPAGSGRGSGGSRPSSPASIISRASRTAGTKR